MRCRLVAARRLARSDAHRLAHAHCLARSTNARRVTTYVRPAEGGDVYLVGTAHVGTRSRDEVANIVDTVRPATVVVELCRPRAEALRNGAGESQSSIGPTLERLGLDAATARIAAGVFDRFAGSVTQGGDMLAAIDAAERVGARVVYGDMEGASTERAVRAAVGELFASPKMADLARRLAGDPDAASIMTAAGLGALQGGISGDLLDGALARMMTRENAAKIGAVLDRHAPQVAEALLHRRDARLHAEIAKAALRDGVVVGVVGMAHLPGIERRFDGATTLELPA